MIGVAIIEGKKMLVECDYYLSKFGKVTVGTAGGRKHELDYDDIDFDIFKKSYEKVKKE